MSGAKAQSGSSPSPQASAKTDLAKAEMGRLKSMTGYAQATAVEHGYSLRISVRSVNHRFLDLHLRVPEGFEPFEPRIRQLIRENIRRGHVDVTLYYDLAGPAAVAVNQEVATAYLQAIYSLREKFEGKAEVDLASLLRLPGVIGTAGVAVGAETAQIEAAVVATLKEALEKLDRMREREAELLREEMSLRLDTIARLTNSVSVLAARSLPAFARRLELRLKELLGEAQMDPARIAQEAAMAAERSDVSEELARLGSHVQQFRGLLTGVSDVGKKLDFLLQEMQRESNTLLSKTPGNEAEGLEITRSGLEIKSEIEKLREQIQNIE
jgi:uncharacterized protein (TIGR00255 family)